MFHVMQYINGMRAQIAVQCCPDRVQLFTPDSSHVAYLSQMESGDCPAGYPVQTPLFIIEADYAHCSVPKPTEDDRCVFS